MKNHIMIIPLTGAVLISLISLTGCSVIGYGIGSAIDGSNENYRIMEKWELDEAKKGRKIRVTLGDGEVVKGKYRGLDSLDYQDYLTKCNYSVNRLSDSIALPCPDDSVTIVTKTDYSISGRLLGYDINYMIDNEKDSTPDIYRKSDLNVLSLKDAQNNLPLDLLLTGVKSITTERGDFIDGSLLRETAASDGLPLRSAVNVRIRWDKNQIPVDQIETVEIDSAHHTKYYLLAVGLALDAFFIAIGIAMSQMDMGLGSGSGSSW